MDVAVLLDEGRSHACYEAGFHTSWSDLAEHPLPADCSPVRSVFRGEVPYLLATDALSDLRERVTSKGGTTHAAITSLQRDHVDAAFVGALKAARDRAVELGDEYG